MTDATQAAAPSETELQKLNTLNSLAEEFIRFKNYVTTIPMHNPTLQNAINHLDTGFLWLREAVFAASSLATEAENLGVPLPESVQVAADVVNTLASADAQVSAAAVPVTDAAPSSS